MNDADVSVDLLAEVTARLDSGESRDSLLREKGLSPGRFQEEQERWLAQIGAQVLRGEFKLQRRYAALYEKHLQDARRRPTTTGSTEPTSAIAEPALAEPPLFSPAPGPTSPGLTGIGSASTRVTRTGSASAEAPGYHVPPSSFAPEPIFPGSVAGASPRPVEEPALGGADQSPSAPAASLEEPPMVPASFGQPAARAPESAGPLDEPPLVMHGAQGEPSPAKAQQAGNPRPRVPDTHTELGLGPGQPNPPPAGGYAQTEPLNAARPGAGNVPLAAGLKTSVVDSPVEFLAAQRRAGRIDPGTSPGGTPEEPTELAFTPAPAPVPPPDLQSSGSGQAPDQELPAPRKRPGSRPASFAKTGFGVASPFATQSTNSPSSSPPPARGSSSQEPHFPPAVQGPPGGQARKPITPLPDPFAPKQQLSPSGPFSASGPSPYAAPSARGPAPPTAPLPDLQPRLENAQPAAAPLPTGGGAQFGRSPFAQPGPNQSAASPIGFSASARSPSPGLPVESGGAPTGSSPPGATTGTSLPLSLEQIACIEAELQLSPSRRRDVLTQNGVSEEGYVTQLSELQARMAADEGTLQRFEQLKDYYRSVLGSR